MKNSYHSEGLGKNKKIRKERKKPLPIGLMLNESKRPRTNTRRTDEDIFTS